MGSVEIRVTYRPIRIGFLVRDGQVEDVVAASKLAVLFWGGIYNPIIPVSQDASVADHRELNRYYRAKQIVSI